MAHWSTWMWLCDVENVTTRQVFHEVSNKTADKKKVCSKETNNLIGTNKLFGSSTICSGFCALVRGQLGIIS